MLVLVLVFGGIDFGGFDGFYACLVDINVAPDSGQNRRYS